MTLFYGFLCFSPIIISIIVFKILDKKEFDESVEIYQLSWDQRVKFAHLKYPKSNDGIWEWNNEK